MDLDESAIKYYEIFRPGAVEEVSDIGLNNTKFVYYTYAETAEKILKHGELWFRNATVMNDFSEISYGLGLTQSVFGGPEGDKFKQVVDSIHPGTSEYAEKYSSKWQHDWIHETYLACVSIHNTAENQSGRLSMWRAYGNVAMVINNTPMTSVTDLLSVYSIPVKYHDVEKMKSYVRQIINAIERNRDYILRIGRDALIMYIKDMMFMFAVATKHPGFEEEREWRLFYRPNEHKSPGMVPEIVVINGVPQRIYKIKLRHAPEIGLFGADIPTLLDRIIIGPTEFPYVSYHAFVSMLNDCGVQNAGNKVIVSDIPLRVRS